MSRADEYRYQIQRQRKQELDRQRVRETTRPFLERYRSVLNDVIGQGLDAVVPEEFRELSFALDRMETLLDSDPFAARDMSRSLGGRLHGLPRFAREQRRSRQDAELAAAEAFRKAQQAEAERQLQMRSELEAAWREGLSGWSTPVAINAAFAELQQLRARLLGDVASNMTSAQISAALREVRLRYEGDAERQLQEMKNRAQREAVTDVLTLQREQLEQEAKKNGGERAASGQQVLPRAVVQDIRRGADPAKFVKAGYATLPGWSYRNMWWVSHNPNGAYMARGIHGQAIYIDPKAQMVVVRYASHPIAGNAGIDPTSLPMYQALADALQGVGVVALRAGPRRADHLLADIVDAFFDPLLQFGIDPRQFPPAAGQQLD